MKQSTKIIKTFLSKFAFTRAIRQQARRFLSNCFNDNGINNKFIIIENGIERNLINLEELYNITSISNSIINIMGSNNVFKLHLPTKLENFILNCSSNNTRIEICSNCTLRNSQVTIWGGGVYDSVVKFGKGCSIWKNFELFVSGSSSFIMEDDCMLSYNITVWCGDGHQILNKNNKEIINFQKEPLKIGYHSWISNNVLITKNAQIPPHTIIGMGSVVSKKFIEENTCIAGNPACVVKRNITWSRENNL